MASKMRFKSGSTTVTFDGTTDGYLVEYDQQIPQTSYVAVRRATEDGQERPSMTYRDVDELAVVMLEGTLAQMKATARKLNAMFQRARRTQIDSLNEEDEVFIEVTMDGDASDWLWRSKILKVGGGNLEDRAVDMYLEQGSVVLDIEFTRRFCWEYTSEVELGLYHPGVTKGTGGKQIYNCSDAYLSDRYDYLDIDNADLIGDLPAPLRIELDNDYNSATRNAKVWININYKQPTTNLDHILEAEDGTGGTTQPGAADYQYSGGYYKAITWTSTGNVLAWYDEMSSNFLEACAGRHFQVFGKPAGSVSTQISFKLVIRFAVTAVYQSAWVRVPTSWSDAWLDFGVVRLPPSPVGDSSPYPLEIAIYGRGLNVGTKYFNLDYVRLVPMDRWKQALDFGYGFAYTTYLVVDDINNIQYTYDWSTAGRVPNYRTIPTGRSLYVTPVPEGSGSQRVYFAWMPHTNARTLTVRMWYRPRKLSL